jgi:hypothetical protein
LPPRKLGAAKTGSLSLPEALTTSGSFGRSLSSYCGRPFSSIPVAQVIFETKGEALMNFPVSRFRT